MSKPKIHLVSIDPQNDFTLSTGALYVAGGPDHGAGGEVDMQVLAKFISDYGDRFEDIHVTLDSHHTMHVAHPWCWVGKDGKNPPVMQTVITAASMEDGTWRPAEEGLYRRYYKYLQDLEAGGRYPHFIWNPHCLIGTPGAAVHADVFAALNDWAIKNLATIDFVPKGSNPYVEHFSAVKAEVIDDEDPIGTGMNTDLIDTLAEADKVLFTGQARSHCVANTIRDIAVEFGDDQIDKIVLLDDTCSDVVAPGIEHFGPDFVSEMTAKGMQVATTQDVWSVIGW